MSLWHIAWGYLWNRKLTTSMTILSVALGVALISTVLTLREETRKRFEEEGQAFDLVVGQIGNPLQLVLSSVYFLDAPTGNIDWSVYEGLQQDPDVVAAYPIGLGDSYRGCRIVGTSHELFEFEWGDSGRKVYDLQQGKYFDAPFEAVIGAAVADATGLELGKTFTGTHGFMDIASAEQHEAHPYTVVGILERSGTPNDRAIFVDMQSVWDVHGHAEEECTHEDHEGHDHGHEKEVTAVLLKLESPALRFEVLDRLKDEYRVLVAIPIMEIQKLYSQILGIAKAVLLAIGYLVVVISSISILIGLYLSILQRKRDLAVMRALGASKGEIFGSVLIEAFWVTILGIVAGWVLGVGTCYVLGLYLTQKIGFYVPPVSWTPDLVTAYSAVVLMGMVAGLLPAWQAYRGNVAHDLAEL